MEVKINLKNPPSTEKVNVDLQWNIKVTAPKPGLLAKMFRKHNRVNRSLRLSITDIKVPKDIICDKENLFSILRGDEVINQKDFPVDVVLTGMDSPFQLLFHQGEIKDCKKPQDANPRVYPIKFKVELRDLDNNIVDTLNECIHVIFEPLGIKPKYILDLEEDDIQYGASLKSEKVGDFVAYINEEVLFVPDHLAKVSLKLFQGKKDISDLISLDANGSNIRDLTISRGRSNLIKLPIYINFTSISNPIEEKEDFTIEAIIESSPSYSPEIKETIIEQTQFSLLKDLQGTELKVYMKVGEDPAVVCESERSFPAIPMSFVPRSRMMGQVDVILSNIATDKSNPRAGLYIKNLTLSESIVGDVQVIGEKNSILERFISIDGAGVDAMNGYDGLFIPNGMDAKTIIHLSFNPSGIVDVLNSRSYDFEVKSVLTFDYWEDKDGTGNLSVDDKKEGKIPVVWKLHLMPNPEWLCVDYGSSAIVCRYDKEILDLKTQKNRIFRNVEDGKFRVDTIEGNTKFLSSDIVLHAVRETDESTLCSQQPKDAQTPYLNLSVCLSPTSSLIKNDVKTQLPCLKILVGNKYLPEKPDFMTFRYTRRDSEGRLSTLEAKKAMEDDEENCIVKISSIFNEAYAALFKYFILPQSQDKSINKLVLTYPNTYTPAHLRVLEKIAHDTFPKLRSGYLRFVGESDAVAAYYLQNWDSFNEGKDIKEDETVLVFDMGAGTLDITLFKKSINKRGKIEVKILGKIGTGKAGNYLDYLIAEIIAQRVPNTVKGQKTVTTDSVPDVQTLIERLDLKDAIKNRIKPNLKPNTKLKYGNVEFDSSEILEDPRFEEFLDQITYGILNQLKSYIGDKHLMIDTVIMSGRSCRLEVLQQALGNALKRLNNSQTRIIKFETDGDKEKTVVVEGAMARAGIYSSAESPVTILSRRLFASYGLIYKKTGGSWHYTELLRSSDLDYISDQTQLDEFESKNVIAEDTASADSIKLIQTYLSPEDTEKAYNSGDLEFISEMEEYSAEDFGQKNSLNVKLKLDYKNNISLYVDGRKSLGSAPKGVDLSSEITKRSIWPVTI